MFVGAARSSAGYYVLHLKRVATCAGYYVLERATYSDYKAGNGSEDLYAVFFITHLADV